MAKQSTKNAGKASVIEYLKKHPNTDIQRDQLMEITSISKSRLSEILKSLREDDGYTIVAVKRKGIIRYEPESQREQIAPPITDADIRQWLIYFFLTLDKDMTFNSLLLKMLSLTDRDHEKSELLLNENNKQVYDDTKLIKSIRYNLSNLYDEDTAEQILKAISVTSLRRHLTELINLEIIKKKSSSISELHPQTKYCLTNTLPRLLQSDYDSLADFCQRYEEQISVMDKVAMENIYFRIKDQICYEASNINHQSFGKLNMLDSRQRDAFNRFISSPYKDKLLDIVTKKDGEEIHTKFAAGLLYYSVETGYFYILGKNLSLPSPEVCSPYSEVVFDPIESRRLDRIDKIIPLKEPNTSYNSVEFRQIYSEIFATGYPKNEIYHVKVLYSDLKSVKRRFDKLKEKRNTTATIRVIPSPPEGCDFKYVYEDRIRGLEDFARYLRSFGRAVLAVEPAELTEKMMGTYQRIKEKYE